MKNRKWLLLLDYSIAWTIALAIYTLVRGVGTIEKDGVQMSIGMSLLIAPVFGTVLGLVFGISQLNFERLYNKRTKLATLFAFRFVVSIFIMLLISVLAYFVFTTIVGYTDLKLIDFLVNPPVFIFYGYVFVVDFLISLFRQVSLMLGAGTLRKLIKGQFYTPREEERIFMFLDLRSSTEMAEKLGHFKYSRMIQDCFDDLVVVTETEAEIYQYVGDEAVLTWERKSGLKNQNCIKAFYRFQKKINDREAHYIAEYGEKPFFKAGLNVGKVTVVEVGKIKKEIAYHGDTINTAARIQGKCNDFKSEILISEKLKSALGEDFGYETNHLGQIPLKGKASEVSIYDVKERV